MRDNCCGEAFRDDGRWHSCPIITALDLIAVDLKRLNGFLIILIRPYLLDLHWNRIVLVAAILQVVRCLMRGTE